jgi:Ribbon-helix-helix protein, copG family
MAGDRRVDAIEYATRINAAVVLVEAGMPVAEATTALASRWGVSQRQAHRYVDAAVTGGQVPVPEPSVVFTVKLPAALAQRVRAHARDRGITISAAVTRALTEFVTRSRPGRRPR